MAKSKSSNDWLREHFDDPYVKKAQKAGYRSRATFKLEEIDKKDKLIKPGMSVVDLGSAPGGLVRLCIKKVRRYGDCCSSGYIAHDTFIRCALY